jgi:hypothetical protein
MSFEQLEENPEKGTSGLTSASQIMDTTSVDSGWAVHTTDADEDRRIFITVPVPPSSRRTAYSPVPNDAFERALEEVFNEDDALLRRLAG